MENKEYRGFITPIKRMSFLYFIHWMGLYNPFVLLLKISDNQILKHGEVR